MFKQEDYTMINESQFPNSEELENYTVTITSQDFRMNSQDFNLGSIPMEELVPLDVGSSLLSLSPPQDETTMDVTTKFQFLEFVPTSPRGPPERTVFPGELDFQVEINGNDTNKKKYLFSSQLNRIYVDMKIDFPVSFRWKYSAFPGALFVRASVVFSDSAQAEKRVERCTQHTHDASNAGVQANIVKNVLHSSRSAGTAGIYYCGRADEADSWYSVVVQLPAGAGAGAAGAGVGAGAGAGGASWSHAFQFVCKNSCSSGINRRAIDVIFTLEDAGGRVLGRQSVGARVCACPLRDMRRDEEAAGVFRTGKKRVQCNQLEKQTKKIKLEVVPDRDDTVLSLPPLEIVGVRPMITGLEVMLSMMEQATSLKRNDPQALEKLTKSITALRAKIDDLKKPQ